jgi:GNAT superfamily N-acetyltransferase
MFQELRILGDEPSPDDLQLLNDQINEHNMMRTGRRDYRPVSVFLRDERGSLVAGLHGFTWAGWLEIKLVWVREDQRGQGLGRRMLAAAEAEARERGCRHVWLDSYTFQAPEFYRHFGYEVFGSLADYPPPHDRVFLTKTL